MKMPGYGWLCAGIVWSTGCEPNPQDEGAPASSSAEVTVSSGSDEVATPPDAATAAAHASTEGATTVVEAEAVSSEYAHSSHTPEDAGTFGSSAGDASTRAASTWSATSAVEPTADSYPASGLDAGSETTANPGPNSTANPSSNSTGGMSGGTSTGTDSSSDAAALTAITDTPSLTQDTHSDGHAPIDAGPDATPEADAGPPALTSLQFVGGYTPLYPEFDPGRTRYSIIATTASSVLSVIATTTGSAGLRVNGVALVDEELTELADVRPGSEIVFTLGDEPNAPHYSVQYLPPNFPELRVENPAPGASQDPLYISLISSESRYIAKLDAAGVPLFYREGAANVYDFKKHPNGTYSYSEKRSSSVDGSYQVLLDSNFEETARLSTVGLANTDVHDFLILPNGNHVFIAEEPAVHDLSSFGLSATQSVLDGMFQEVDPNQQVVFQWNSWDHTQYDESVYAFRTKDYAHLNSISLDHDDNWLLSSRGFSQVFKIDRTTGAVIWRLGGISTDFAFVDDPYNGFCGQHTAERLDNGHILLFDNARDCLPEVLGSRPDRSRAVEYALDEVSMTAAIAWSYERDGLVAASQGSTQRLSNGNTMIGWGSGPRVLASEVTQAGEVAYELTGRARNNARVSSYRARKFAD